eukprot:Tamp_06640.p2 GENE.Tamp_06640~~Tamp_06640.p2  ORF type:complete len:233 (+),score=73.17 Tamp_06640:1854-2552(+)
MMDAELALYDSSVVKKMREELAKEKGGQSKKLEQGQQSQGQLLLHSLHSKGAGTGGQRSGRSTGADLPIHMTAAIHNTAWYLNGNKLAKSSNVVVYSKDAHVHHLGGGVANGGGAGAVPKKVKKDEGTVVVPAGTSVTNATVASSTNATVASSAGKTKTVKKGGKESGTPKKSGEKGGEERGTKKESGDKGGKKESADKGGKKESAGKGGKKAKEAKKPKKSATAGKSKKKR